VWVRRKVGATRSGRPVSLRSRNLVTSRQVAASELLAVDRTEREPNLRCASARFLQCDEAREPN